MTYRSVRAQFTHIAFIDLLSSEGQSHVYEEIRDSVSAANNANVSLTTERHKISSTDDLVRAMSQILHAEYLPIIHIDGHGSDEGIEISATGKIVPWAELHQLLRPLNIKLKCRLIVLYSTCYGAHSLADVLIDKEAPFFATIGFIKEVGEQAAIELYRDFYSKIDNLGFVDERLAECRNKEQAALFDLRWYFLDAAKQYIRKPSRTIRKELKGKSKELNSMLKKSGKHLSKAERRDILDSHASIEGRKKLLLKASKTFFMHDIDHSIWEELEIEQSIQRLRSNEIG